MNLLDLLDAEMDLHASISLQSETVDSVVNRQLIVREGSEDPTSANPLIHDTESPT
jgi:hypothetical protein